MDGTATAANIFYAASQIRTRLPVSCDHDANRPYERRATSRQDQQTSSSLGLHLSVLDVESAIYSVSRHSPLTMTVNCEKQQDDVQTNKVSV